MPFSVTIPPDERDPDLAAKLELEWPAILRWAIQGCLEWQKIGLAPPPSVLAATEDYLSGEDAFGLWHADCCTDDPRAWETASELFASWKRWAEAAGEPVGTQRRFAQLLDERGFQAERRGKNRTRGYLGARINRPDYTDDARYGG